jgi:hypothetical protein
VPTLDSVDPLRYSDGAVTASVSDEGADGWYGADAALTLIGGSDVKQYRLGDGSWTAYDSAVDLPAGSYDVAWRSRSANGVWSEVWTRSVKVDDAPPVVSGSVSADRRLTVSATDDASGVAVREYRLDGGAWIAWTSAVQLDGAAHVVGVRAVDVAGNTSPVRSLPVAALPAPGPAAPVSTAPPLVAGNPVVGHTLTAVAGGWDQGGLTFTYQWLRDGVPVVGATSARLALGASDVGHRMSVQVTASRPGGAEGVAQSAPSSPVAKARSRVKVSLDRTPAAGVRTRLVARVASAEEVAGRVVVRVDGKVVRRARLSSERAVLRLAFSAGTHTVKVSYAGSGSVARSSSKVKVRTHR